MNAKLKYICDAVTGWCEARSLPFDIACDENDLQGIMLFRRDRAAVADLVNYLKPMLDGSGVHMVEHRVRSGTVLVFSLRAVSELDMKRAVGNVETGGGNLDDHARKIAAVFDGPAPAAAAPTLRETAKKLFEAQRKLPTRANSRSQSTSQHRSSVRPGAGDEVKRGNKTKGNANATTVPGQSTNRPTLGGSTGVGFAAKLESVLNSTPLSELASPQPTPGLNGLGAEHQPVDLFKRFAEALQVLGQQMSIGPIQNLLKQQGIKWKKSDDGQALIFFVNNADTKAPQPIARIGYQTLSKPQEFQKQLAYMLDFAKGQAPGTEQQKYDEAQEAQKRLREIANQMAPNEQQGQNGQTPMMQPQPQVPQPQPPKAQMQPKPAEKPAPGQPTRPRPGRGS